MLFSQEKGQNKQERIKTEQQKDDTYVQIAHKTLRRIRQQIRLENHLWITSLL